MLAWHFFCLLEHWLVTACIGRSLFGGILCAWSEQTSPLTSFTKAEVLSYQTSTSVRSAWWRVLACRSSSITPLLLPRFVTMADAPLASFRPVYPLSLYEQSFIQTGSTLESIWGEWQIKRRSSNRECSDKETHKERGEKVTQYIVKILIKTKILIVVVMIIILLLTEVSLLIITTMTNTKLMQFNSGMPRRFWAPSRMLLLFG